MRAPVTRALPVLDAARPASAATRPCAISGSANGDSDGCSELSPRHAALLAAGWTRRFAAAPPRLEEMSRTYGEMGFAVLHEPLDDALLGGDCAGCAPARAGFRVIYTRKEP
jgi:hypothetical protein